MPLVFIFQAVLPAVRAVAVRRSDVVVAVTHAGLTAEAQHVALAEVLTSAEFAAYLDGEG